MGDLEEICRIYADARAFMKENGNPNQWKDGRPGKDTAEGDILAGKSYVCVNEGEIVAVFYFAIEHDPTYENINGGWQKDGVYGVVHRIARSRASSAKGASHFCLDWCFRQCGNLKIDTHQDNVPMRNLLAKLGFAHCGIIWLANGEERLAFQKV
jgi:RimJ/RimL family protein N-acetyltransferase